MGNVSGNFHIGGIAGNNNENKIVQNCYNTGSIKGNMFIGGIVGDNSGTIQQCYSAGSVKSIDISGGVVGYKDTGTVTSCYYDKQMCPVGGIEGNDYEGQAEGKLTLEMTSGAIFYGWSGDETGAWSFTAGLYPRLTGYDADTGTDYKMDETEVALVSTSPVFLTGTETVATVKSDFTLGGTENGVTWASRDEGVISIVGDNAKLTGSGSVILNATRGSISKSVMLTVAKLAVHSNLSWDAETHARATWDAVANASSYTVQLYKGGITYGSPITRITNTYYDFDSVILEDGTYTFTVQAIGNGTTYTDSDESLQSPEYIVLPPSIGPATHNYDLYAPSDVTATITWRRAKSVTDAVYCVTTSTADYHALDTDDYDINDDTLTIKSSFFSGLSVTSGAAVEFVFTFNTGNTATLTVNVVDSFVPVTNITGVPDAATAGTPLTLAGTVEPGNATNQTITWSVYNDGGTGASIVGNILSTTSAGIVTVRATITNGLTASTDYTQDFDITVSAAPITTYTITATAGSGGSITPGGAVSVNEGDSQTFSITANPGYRISAVLVDGVSQGAITSYTFTNVTDDHTINAIFAQISSPVAPWPLEKTITLTEISSELFKNAKDAIIVEADMKNAFASSVEIRLADTQEDAASFRLSAVDEVYPFDISIYIKGTNTITKPAPGYAVTIFLPIPENLLNVKEQLIIMHKSDSGIVTEIASRLVQRDGVWYIVFEATESSPYALVVRKTGRYDETSGVPYYFDSDGNKMFIGFAANGKYIAPAGVTVSVTRNGKSFTDIAGHWAVGYIGFVAEREIFNGTGGGTFSPDTGMTRAMFATVIGRLYERSFGRIETTGTKTFTDCDYSAYYGKYIAWASEKGIIDGYGNCRFGPDDQITREQMATILYRFADFLGVIPDSVDTVLSYPDADSISDYAWTAALYCQTTGIIGGRGGGVFAPKETATRAEVATIIQRFIEVVLG